MRRSADDIPLLLVLLTVLCPPPLPPPQTDTLRDKLDEIFARLGDAPDGGGGGGDPDQPTVYRAPTLQQMRFPELFVY